MQPRANPLRSFCAQPRRVLAAALVLLTSCSSRPDSITPAPVITQPASLEVQVWTVSDAAAAVPRALHEFEARPLPIPESLRLRYRAYGIRVVSVPLARLPELRQAFATAGPTEHSRIVEQGQWRPIVTGLPADGRVELESGLARFDPGVARLLARSWTIPLWPSAGPPSRGVVVGLALEWFIEQKRSGFSIEPPEPIRHRFDRLDAEFLLDPDSALLIVASRPEESWEAQVDAWRRRNSPVAPEEWGVGPVPERPRTLGELILGPWRDVRRVVVLVPQPAQ